MLLIQEQLNNDATAQLQSSDQNRVSTKTDPETTFEDNSYVLAINPNGPLTRLHTKWQGPFKVIKHDRSQYTLMNLITKKHRDIHASQLKIFHFCHV